jgi:hypothetical protein
MRHLAQLALACLVLTGSLAEAKKSKKNRVDDDEVKRAARERAEAEAAEAEDEAPDDDRVGARADDEDLIDDVDLKATKKAPAKLREWNFAIGPYLWASAVEADVSLGSESVGAGVDFMDISRHARYGIPLQAEARYGRFSVAADFLYGVVDLAGNREVGPVMVSVDGTASSLLFDGAAGVLLAGGDHSILSVEARAGVRYQRTAVNGQIGLDNSPVASPTKVDAASDAIGGARIALRPFEKLAITGTFDTRMFGDSAQSWSGSGDASYQLGKRIMVSLGWRTLTTQRANLSLTMYGPRAAVHVLF